jgi:hypothetical protein
VSGFIVAAALLALGLSGSARGAQIVLLNRTVIADIGAGASLGADPTLGSPNGGPIGGPLARDIGFVAPFGCEITITIRDLGTTTDTGAGSGHQGLLDRAAVGVTRATAIDASPFSSRAFSFVGTGRFRSLGLWDFISTFQGSSSPFGGLVDQDFAPATVPVLITEAPEPTSLTLMGASWPTFPRWPVSGTVREPPPEVPVG